LYSLLDFNDDTLVLACMPGRLTSVLVCNLVSDAFGLAIYTPAGNLQ